MDTHAGLSAVRGTVGIARARAARLDRAWGSGIRKHSAARDLGGGVDLDLGVGLRSHGTFFERWITAGTARDQHHNGESDCNYSEQLSHLASMKIGHRRYTASRTRVNEKPVAGQSGDQW